MFTCNGRLRAQDSESSAIVAVGFGHLHGISIQKTGAAGPSAEFAARETFPDKLRFSCMSPQIRSRRSVGIRSNSRSLETWHGRYMIELTPTQPPVRDCLRRLEHLNLQTMDAQWEAGDSRDTNAIVSIRIEEVAIIINHHLWNLSRRFTSTDSFNFRLATFGAVA